MTEADFARLVSLACHDLRTPLASVNGVAKMLLSRGELSEDAAPLVALMEGAAGEMALLLDQLGLAAKIAAGRYEPVVRDVDTLELASSADVRIDAVGRGAVVSTDAETAAGALEGLARAALRHGGVAAVTWSVDGLALVLSPLREDAAAVVAGSDARDLRALVARMALEALGASLVAEGERLRVELVSV